ncbi:hypothetical protein PVAND_008997 [Polypedilum vanderplanki]|uniref:Uncharacterized protein n=1 Tax=Polypedilum vanderplanki TaxID=319348 RepID=A0A9J6CCS2_POLVA|nr:hypothetical protein PVAND_008997 [Polypedilum vanderplanki]
MQFHVAQVLVENEQYWHLSIDLEFSIGRPIFKLWLVLWSIVPVLLTAIVTCFIVFPTTRISSIEPIINDIVPKWIPIIICLLIIILVAIYETTKQVDYNTFNMIHEATKAAKDWGPADPLVRHAWKQWKSVCDDTGQRDFTLKRRGTKDWTNSIKKGQYSHAKRNTNTINGAHKYNNGNTKTHHIHQTSTPSMTGGSNSPNYSGSVFGDSAIEEDISCGEKYGDNSRRSSNNINRQHSDGSHHHQHRLYQAPSSHDEVDEMNNRNNNNYQKIPIRIAPINDHQRIIKRNSYLQAQNDQNDDDNDEEHFASRIEILPPEIHPTFTLPLPTPPPAQFQAQSTFMPITTTRNPLCQIQQRNLISNIVIGAGDAGYSDNGSYSTKTTSNRTPSDAAYNDNWRRLQSGGEIFKSKPKFIFYENDAKRKHSNKYFDDGLLIPGKKLLDEVRKMKVLN